MPDTIRCYGPPGTGKTHSGVSWIEYQIAQGADPEGVAFVSYTNSACDEARRRVCGRLGLLEYEMPYCATLHALCKRALRIGTDGKEWLAEGKPLKEFAEHWGYDLIPARKSASEDMDEVIHSGGHDAVLLAIWNFGRSRLLFDADAAWRAFEAYDPETADRVEYARFVQFVIDYEEWKRAGYHYYSRLYDYTDLLKAILDQPCVLPVSIAVVDEAQDMTPLLWAARDVLLGGAQVAAALGDDDQAIYSYQGANPALFNERTAGRIAQLHQSRRLSRSVWELAQRVIRQNRSRVEKDFRPVDAAIVERRPDRTAGPATEAELIGRTARVRSIRDLHFTSGETWMLLVRNWAHVREVSSDLEEHGVPYVVGSDYYSPWSERGPLRAVKSLLRLSDGERVKLGELAPFLDKTRAQTSDARGAWQYGQKARVKERIDADPDEGVSLFDLPQLGLTEWGFDCIATRDLTLFAGSISERDLNAYKTAQRLGTFNSPVRLTVSTIHGVKGQEADNVAALMGCTAAPFRNLERADRQEEETRLAYVAITRARKRFFGIECDGFGFPYEVFGV